MIEKPLPFRKQLHKRILDGDDRAMIAAERILQRLLLVWVVVRLAVSFLFLVAIGDHTQAVTAVVTLLFAYFAVICKPLAILGFVGGLLTVFQVFNLKYFEIASANGSSLLFGVAVLLLAVGVIQTLVMGYIILNKKLQLYYELVRQTRMDFKRQSAEYANHRRNSR